MNMNWLYHMNQQSIFRCFLGFILLFEICIPKLNASIVDPFSTFLARERQHKSENILPSFRHNYKSGSYLSSQSCHYVVQLNGGCEKPLAVYSFPPYGFGAALHTWAAAMCWAIVNNYTLIAVAPGSLTCPHSGYCYLNTNASQHTWLWEHEELCRDSKYPMCYWPHVNHCADHIDLTNKKIPQSSWITPGCDVVSGCDPLVDSPCGSGFFNQIQYLFSEIHPMILKYGQTALLDVFGQNGSPDNMITLHIRWGDKWKEAHLISIEAYVEAVEEMVDTFHLEDDVNIYITTEDNAAIIEFKDSVKTKHPNWKVLSYGNAIQLNRTSSAERTTKSPPDSGNDSKGAAGVESIIALLLALEGKYTITTASSNWGRLIDELHEWVWSWPNKNRPKKFSNKDLEEKKRLKLWANGQGQFRGWKAVFEDNPVQYSALMSTKDQTCDINKYKKVSQVAVKHQRKKKRNKWSIF